MISDFDQLHEKLTQLAAMAESLRRENSELRRFATGVVAENGELTRRMQEAQQRVEALLVMIPAPVVDDETSEADDDAEQNPSQDQEEAA